MRNQLPRLDIGCVEPGIVAFIGIVAALLARCESWAKEKSCTEFASDCELLNEASIRFHKALDFSEANRIVCFRKE